MIKTLCEALEKRDFIAVAECFGEDGKYIDYCPAQVKMDDWFLYGKGHVEMWFRNRFTMGSFSAFDPRPEDDTHATWFACYNGVYVPALLTVEYAADGKIAKAVVRPE